MPANQLVKTLQSLADEIETYLHKVEAAKNTANGKTLGELGLICQEAGVFQQWKAGPWGGLLMESLREHHPELADRLQEKLQAAFGYYNLPPEARPGWCKSIREAANLINSIVRDLDTTQADTTESTEQAPQDVAFYQTDLEDRLRGWKEIASLCRVSIRKAQDYEKEGMPVSRPDGPNGVVLASKAELAVWLARKK